MANRPLTIVQMVPELNCGGVEQVAVELSTELAKKGHRLIVLSSGGQLVSQLQEQGVEHQEWPIRAKSPLTLKAIWPLRRFFRKENVDIVHAHSRIPAWVGYLAWKGMPVASRPRFVTTAHGLYRVNRYSEVMTRGQRVIAISETVQDYLQRNYKRLNPECIRTIPLGIDGSQFPRDFTPSQQWTEKWYADFPQLLGVPNISLIGRIVRLKGHSDLIEIVDQLRSEIPAIKALIVGGIDPRRAQYAEEIQQEIKRRGLEQHFVLTGQRNDVREIYAISNLVLGLTSNPPEAFGRTTIEALSMGVPVVGYDHGGTGEILRKVFPEGLVTPGDIQLAAERIRALIQSPPKLTLEHPYLKTKMVSETVAVYEELAA